MIYPVDTEKFKRTSDVKEEFYVTCSRMVPYKKIDLIVETFTVKFPEKVLVVLGDGQEYKNTKHCR